MSQAKVDRYKEEKKNRAKIIKKQKIAKVISVFLVAGLLGAAVGYPLGLKFYKDSAARAKEKSRISSVFVGQYIDQYIATNYSEIGNSYAAFEVDTLDEDTTGENITDAETTGEDTTEATSEEITE